jgi:hypothetical protein
MMDLSTVARPPTKLRSAPDRRLTGWFDEAQSVHRLQR